MTLGSEMTSKQYEELCRYFLAMQLGIAIDRVISIEIPNPQRPGLLEYKHQIDLYWEVSDSVAMYLNIGNAKWRGSCKVDQPEVLLLQQVKQKVAAHKAIMLTNSEFTAGAVAAAQDDGIALHIVRPEFDASVLSFKNAPLIRQQIQDLAGKLGHQLYSHEVIYKAFDLAPAQTLALGLPTEPTGGAPDGGRDTRSLAGFSTKSVTSSPNRYLGGGPSNGSGGGPRYRAK